MTRTEEDLRNVRMALLLNYVRLRAYDFPEDHRQNGSEWIKAFTQRAQPSTRTVIDEEALKLLSTQLERRHILAAYQYYWLDEQPADEQYLHAMALLRFARKAMLMERLSVLLAKGDTFAWIAEETALALWRESGAWHLRALEPWDAEAGCIAKRLIQEERHIVLPHIEFPVLAIFLEDDGLPRAQFRALLDALDEKPIPLPREFERIPTPLDEIAETLLDAQVMFDNVHTQTVERWLHQIGYWKEES